MDRRSFLGSILGSFAASQIPWIGAKIDAPLIRQPIVIPGYRTAVRLLGGEVLQGPGIVLIDGGILTYAPIEARTSFHAVGCLLWKDGRLLSEQKFRHGGISLFNGDTLNITHTIQQEQSSSWEA